MDIEQLRSLLSALGSDLSAQWQPGAALLMIDDESLAWGESNAADVLLIFNEDIDAADLPAWLTANAAELHESYYRGHPLSARGFAKQVRRLFDEHGALSFAAGPGAQPKFSLFVEAGTVVAESQKSPRHRYGAFCAMASAVDTACAEQQALTWLESGEAYSDYLSMNVCRYNC